MYGETSTDYEHPLLTVAPNVVEKPAPIRVSEIQQRVDSLIIEQRRTAKWLYETIGMSKVGYGEMWERESVKVVVLQRIAEALKVPLTYLLYGEVAAARPRYIEQRIEQLEQDVRKLKERLRDR